MSLNKFISYEANLHIPERDIKYWDVINRVDELDKQHEKQGSYRDDVMWSYVDGVLTGTYYSVWDLPFVKNILEVIYHEFVDTDGLG
jgi:hypothetical protein